MVVFGQCTAGSKTQLADMLAVVFGQQQHGAAQPGVAVVGARRQSGLGAQVSQAWRSRLFPGGKIRVGLNGAGMQRQAQGARQGVAHR